jgi:hypothetical protein
VGASCRWEECAFAARSALRAASSTAAASRSVSPLSVASQEHSAVAVAAAAPTVTGVAVPQLPEKVSEGHGDGDRQ